MNQRNDFLHKLSRFYINNLIAMEHLNIYRLGGKILDASWGKFMFSYKAERAGRRVVDPKGDLTKPSGGVRQGLS